MSADLVKGVFGHSSIFYAIKSLKPSKFEIFGMLCYVCLTALILRHNPRHIYFLRNKVVYNSYVAMATAAL